MFIPLILVCLYCLEAEAQRGSKSHEQLHFSAEDETVHRPADIPQDAWKILQKDSYVQNVIENENLTAEQLPRSWFLASAVHLDGPQENDLLVIANDKLAGGNVVTFWLFMQTPKGIKLVLTAPAHDLFIKSSRSHGHRDIIMAGITEVILRYDGNQYRVSSSSNQLIQ
jgi:hypothetical protein